MRNRSQLINPPNWKQSHTSRYTHTNRLSALCAFLLNVAIKALHSRTELLPHVFIRTSLFFCLYLSPPPHCCHQHIPAQSLLLLQHLCVLLFFLIGALFQLFNCHQSFLHPTLAFDLGLKMYNTACGIWGNNGALT